MPVQGRSVSSPTTKATAIASMFTTALGAPRDQEAPEAVRLAVIAFLLDTGVRFGHDVPRDGPSVIWAEIEKAGPGGEAP
jgi:hypothetical protein